MSIGIGVPNGVVNLPTVHMVQTFKVWWEGEAHTRTCLVLLLCGCAAHTRIYPHMPDPAGLWL